MAPKNLLLLFCSTLALSLVVLIIFFSLFFKNVDLSFNTREPDSAPSVNLSPTEGILPSKEHSKSEALQHATINVPPEQKAVESSVPTPDNGFSLPGKDETLSSPVEQPEPIHPVTDDALLDDTPPPRKKAHIDSPPPPRKRVHQREESSPAVATEHQSARASSNSEVAINRPAKQRDSVQREVSSSHRNASPIPIPASPTPQRSSETGNSQPSSSRPSGPPVPGQ
jgi:hypothetical protein